MDFREYQKNAWSNLKEHENLKDEVCDWTIGLSEEVGEVASIVKHWQWGREPIRPEELTEEIGDVLWYLSALCTSLGLDFDAVAKLNIAKLQYRFEDGFSFKKSQDRHEKRKEFKNTEAYKELMSELFLEGRE